MGKKPTRYLENYPRHFEIPPREPGSIERRTDFMYMGGHGTFYKFDKAHYNKNILNATKGDNITLVLYNLNTDQLDEVIFELDAYKKIGKKYLYITGYIADIAECFRIKIEFYLPDPLESFIKVYASARPDHDFFQHCMGEYESIQNKKVSK